MGVALIPYKDHPVVHVPDEMWYRFDDRRYAPPLDEHDEPIAGGGRLAVELQKFWVHHHTSKGVWLTMFRPTGGPLKEYGARFVLKGATKRFACPTIELAKESFIARKRKQASIYRARAAQADQAIQLVEKFK